MASELFARQIRYDAIHHLMRLEWLDSLPGLDALHSELKRQSTEIVGSPFKGYNSVDLDDAEYLAELDEFAANDSRK